jgi:hypothetical protein
MLEVLSLPKKPALATIFLPDELVVVKYDELPAELKDSLAD